MKPKKAAKPKDPNAQLRKKIASLEVRIERFKRQAEQFKMLVEARDNLIAALKCMEMYEESSK